MGNARNTRPKCKHSNKLHFGEFRMKSGVCFRCGSFDHYLIDCPEKSEKGRPNNTATRGRLPRNPGNVSGSRDVMKDSTIRSEAQTLARDYAIRTHEDASVPDVITSTLSFIDIDVIALIDPGSTHSYVCTKLVSSKRLPVESTEFMVKLI
ncbi:uncharacterized protein [Gossypium hirsutum]|uniref:CCHC-type domain-containing protein n=1 Tax=Gossypium hirsutum TaxID=3635 RepID=A0A1U8NX01_GOSHI|nr:uncharacterized protein LOC107951831 [Gossypium hirsutum]